MFTSTFYMLFASVRTVYETFLCNSPKDVKLRFNLQASPPHCFVICFFSDRHQLRWVVPIAQDTARAHLKTRARSQASKARSLEIYLPFNVNYEFSGSSMQSFSSRSEPWHWNSGDCGAASCLCLGTVTYIAMQKHQCNLRDGLETMSHCILTVAAVWSVSYS